MVSKTNEREFLHSLSRITDRLKQLIKDAKRIEADAKNIKEDVASCKSAIDSFVNDYMKGGEQ